jgi:D-alanyl-lipoteichoic acid acyltransferase DltB (MBOAT superfamily)
LLAASYLFYAFFDLRFAGLLLVITFSAYAIGRALPHSRYPRRLVWLSVGLNLGVLGLFKYLNFFLSSVEPVLNSAGLAAVAPSLALLLPVGLSFYTFQAIAYTSDVYRHKAQPARLADLALYLAFFPKLIAGPLVRLPAFFDQAAAGPRRPAGAEVTAALGLLLLGLFKKVVIADSLASLGETAFRAAEYPAGQFATPLFVQGFYLYAFQIYADFSGYTDLARASAALLGYRLPENFRQPYAAATPGAFWNRWHMSLTQWFREYLFFPLSRALLAHLGRARAEWAQTAANLATMLLIGLWHGAAWTFVVWGLWHGLLLTVDRLAGLRPAGRWRWVTGFVTFHLVGVGWIFFRAGSLEAAGRFLAGLAALEQMHWLGHYLPSIIVTAVLVFGLDLVASGWPRLPRGLAARARPAMVVAVVVVLAGLGALSFARGGDARPFIYGQF